MDTLYYLGLLLSIFFFAYELITHKRTRNKKLPPSPPSFPIIGHFHLLKDPLHQTLNNLFNKYGPIIFLRLGSRPTLVLSDRSSIEECFKKNDIIFSNRPHFPSRELSRYNSSTIGAPYGHTWRNLRRFSAIEVFSPKRLLMSSNIRAEEVRLMTKHLFKLEGAHKVDLKSFLYKVDFNIMMRVIAGKKCFEEEELDSSIAQGKLYDLVQMFSPVMPRALGDYFPFLRWLTCYGAERKIIETFKKRDPFMQDLVDTHKHTNSSSSDIDDEINASIIGIMVKQQESEPEFYTDDAIKGIIQAMLIAGTHTTVVTMESAVSLLVSHPDVFKKAREEIDNIVGKSRLLNDADLPKLSYLNCVINETLRFGRVKVLPPRESSEECTVGGYHIPRGTQLLVNVWSVHGDPELWTDPISFIPERFEHNGEGEEKEKEGLKFFPFGIGRRICPGSNLAMRVLGLSLGTLIQCFDWEGAPDETQETMKTNMKKGEERSLQVIFRPRETLAEVFAQL